VPTSLATVLVSPIDDAVEVTEFLDEPPAAPAAPLPDDSIGTMRRFPHPLRHPLGAAAWLVEAGFGIASLILLLAVVAAIPIVNFLALGYLLEVEGRVARSGRLRAAFPLLAQAPRLGAMALGFWLWLLPLRVLAAYTADARLIDASSPVTAGLNRILPIAAALIGLHLCLALARGGSLGCFFRPLRNVTWLIGQLRQGGYAGRAEAAIREFVSSLRLGHHFSLGVRGFVGAAAWLLVPTLLFAAAVRTEPVPILVSIAGGLLLVLVFGWLPFLQARFAAENRLRAFFDWREIRELIRRAPVAWLAALVVTYVLALPLYLSKIVLPPRDAVFLLTPLFIASIYPAKVAIGWAYHRAVMKPERAWFGTRWIMRLAAVALLGGYVFVLFFTPYISEHGRGVLFEHHAFLLPVPF
jgi:hypothetical protein